jgi:acetyl esterase/lipase
MMSGFVLDPPPTALVSYWGFGDIDGEWTTAPNKAFLRGELISDEDAAELVGDRVLTNVNKETGPGRWKYFTYLKQKGTWANVATGYDPATDRDKFTPYCPIRNLSDKYPPILLVHGTADIDVPYEQSVAMAEALGRLGRPHRLITLNGGRHGGWGGDPKQMPKAIDETMNFIRSHLGTH